MRSTRTGLGILLVAYVVAAVIVGFGVAVIASLLELSAIAIAVIVAIVLIALALLVFRGPASRLGDEPKDKE